MHVAPSARGGEDLRPRGGDIGGGRPDPDVGGGPVDVGVLAGLTQRRLGKVSRRVRVRGGQPAGEAHCHPGDPGSAVTRRLRMAKQAGEGLLHVGQGRGSRDEVSADRSGDSTQACFVTRRQQSRRPRALGVADVGEQGGRAGEEAGIRGIALRGHPLRGAPGGVGEGARNRRVEVANAGPLLDPGSGGDDFGGRLCVAPQDVRDEADGQRVNRVSLGAAAQGQRGNRSDDLAHPLDDAVADGGRLLVEQSRGCGIEGPSQQARGVDLANGQAQQARRQVAERVVAGEDASRGDRPAARRDVEDEGLCYPGHAGQQAVDLPCAEGLLDRFPHGRSHDPLVVAAGQDAEPEVCVAAVGQHDEVLALGALQHRITDC